MMEECYVRLSNILDEDISTGFARDLNAMVNWTLSVILDENIWFPIADEFVGDFDMLVDDLNINI